MLRFIPSSILSRVQSLCIIALTLFLAGAIGFFAVEHVYKKNLTAMLAATSAQHNFTKLDMHHESLRAMVFSATSSEEFGSKASSIRAELEETKKEYERLSANLSHQPLPENVTSSIADSDLTRYLALATKAIDTIYTDRQNAPSAVAAFETEFERLKDVLHGSADVIDEHISGLAKDSEAFLFYSQILLCLITLAGIICVSALSLVVARGLIRPLRKQILAVTELASGNTEIESQTANDLSRTDEVGELSRSIATFRTTIIERRRHQAEAEASKQTMISERQKKDELDKYYADAHAEFMSSFTNALEHLSAGHLTYRISTAYISEYETIRESFNRAAGRIQDTMLTIVGNTNSIRSGTSQIMGAAEELARHTEEQASSLEETSASMEEMAATVRQNAGNAMEASTTATTARDLAVTGGHLASQAVDAMAKIERSSRQVTEIVSLIEEIAFQTNILALNAAVEAARAGDAGRGFAVVANEVRTLSQRASQALKDIKQLIASSSNDVNGGAALVKSVGQSLTEIVSTVTKVSELVTEIASASQEQASGIDQVSRAVANMDEMTQQNAALVQETNAALHTAQSQTDALGNAVSVFDIGEVAGLSPIFVGSPVIKKPANKVHAQQSMIAKRMSSVTAKPRRKSAPQQAQQAAVAMTEDEWHEF